MMAPLRLPSCCRVRAPCETFLSSAPLARRQVDRLFERHEWSARIYLECRQQESLRQRIISHLGAAILAPLKRETNLRLTILWVNENKIFDKQEAYNIVLIIMKPI